MRSCRRLTFISLLVVVAGCTQPGGRIEYPPDRLPSPYPNLPATTPKPPSPPEPAPSAEAATPSPPAADLPCVPTSHGCISTNPDVTQATIGSTICVSGYTKTVRPGTSYTNGVKAKLLREQGLDESHMEDYELDHIIPLAVGGHPRKLSNLMLQSWEGEDSAHDKDGLERRLQRMVCRGEVSLADAQRCIAEDWQACSTRYSPSR